MHLSSPHRGQDTADASGGLMRSKEGRREKEDSQGHSQGRGPPALRQASRRSHGARLSNRVRGTGGSRWEVLYTPCV